MTRYNRRSVAGRGEGEPASIVRVAASSDPAFNLVECLAGCLPDRKIVYYAPRPEPAPPATASPRDANIGAGLTKVVDTNVITCVAGCYSTPKSYVARPPLPRQQTAMAPDLATEKIATGSVVISAAVAAVTDKAMAQPRYKRVKRAPGPAFGGEVHRIAHNRGAKVIKVAAPL